MAQEKYSENPYFFITTKSGKQLLGKIKTNPDHKTSDTVEVSQLDDKIFIEKMQQTGFVRMSNVYEIQLARIGGDVKPIPVQYSQTATGSEVLLLASDSIELVNALDENSEVVKAIRAVGSGIIPSATENDIQQSSKLVHKFSQR